MLSHSIERASTIERPTAVRRAGNGAGVPLAGGGGGGGGGGGFTGGGTNLGAPGLSNSNSAFR